MSRAVDDDDYFGYAVADAEAELVTIDDEACRRVAARLVASFKSAQLEKYCEGPFAPDNLSTALVKEARERVSLMHDAARRAYAAGEIDLGQLSGVTLACARCLWCDYQGEFVIDTVEWALTITPERLNRSRPPVPGFLKELAIVTVEILDRACLDQRFAPRDGDPSGSPLLAAALRVLEVLGFVEPGRIQPKTLYQWYRDRQGHSVQRPRGRRRGPAPHRATT